MVLFLACGVACRIKHQTLVLTIHATANLLRPHPSGQSRWWTWAGGRANSVLATALSQVEPGLVDELSQYDNRHVKLPGTATPAAVASAVARARDRFGADLAGAEPKVSDEALKQLKFAELLPPDLASHTLGARSADHDGARLLLQRPVGLRLSISVPAEDGPARRGRAANMTGSKPHAPPAPAATDHLGRNQIGRVTWQSRPARQVGAEADVDDHLRVDVRPARLQRCGLYWSGCRSTCRWWCPPRCSRAGRTSTTTCRAGRDCQVTRPIWLRPRWSVAAGAGGACGFEPVMFAALPRRAGPSSAGTEMESRNPTGLCSSSRAPSWSAERAPRVWLARSGGSSSANLSCLRASSETLGSAPARSAPKRSRARATALATAAGVAAPGSLT